jgi:hypothetical protein
MPKLSGITAGLVDKAMDRYDVPEWARPYVYKYVSRNKVDSIKMAINLVAFGRKKGRITDDYAILPNGMKFKMQSLTKLIGLFFHGEQRLADLESYWASNHVVGNPEYESGYLALADCDYKGARAMKNLVEGLKYRMPEDNGSLDRLFGRLSRLERWDERVFASGIILNHCYMKPFAGMFMRVFHPIVPEFMRNFNKAFTLKDQIERWDLLEARRLIATGKISEKRVKELSEDLLGLVSKSIDDNLDIAKELGIKEEISLLKEISLEYPIHVLDDLGVPLPHRK